MALFVIAVIAAVAFYGYLALYAAITWECKIYVGEHTAQQQKACDDFNSGGMYKLLTN